MFNNDKETITYERLVNTGNYENRRFSITLIVNPGDNYYAVFAKARSVVDLQATELEERIGKH